MRVRALLLGLMLLASPSLAAVYTDVAQLGTSYASLTAAVSAIGNAEEDVYITGVETVDDLTIPEKLRVHFVGGSVSVNAGRTLAFATKSIYAPNRPIFSGDGDVDFAAGTLVDVGWFSTGNLAVSKTQDDTITLHMTKQVSLTSNATLGNNVRLLWESAGNSLIVYGGATLSNVKDIRAGEYQIFSGAGSVAFADGAHLNSAWFARLRTALTMIGSSKVLLRVQRTETVDLNTTANANTTFEVLPGGMLSPNIGVTLTINGAVFMYDNASQEDIVTGAGSVVFAFSGVSSGVVVDSRTLLTDLVVNANETLRFRRGGMLVCDGNSVTVYGTIEAGAYQIFDCDPGEVLMPQHEVLPEWWGAVGDGNYNNLSDGLWYRSLHDSTYSTLSTDDADAMTSACYALRQNLGTFRKTDDQPLRNTAPSGVVRLQPGRSYYLASPMLCEADYSDNDNQWYLDGFGVIGDSSRIVMDANFTGVERRFDRFTDPVTLNYALIIQPKNGFYTQSANKRPVFMASPVIQGIRFSGPATNYMDLGAIFVDMAMNVHASDLIFMNMGKGIMGPGWHFGTASNISSYECLQPFGFVNDHKYRFFWEEADGWDVTTAETPTSSLYLTLAGRTILEHKPPEMSNIKVQSNIGQVRADTDTYDDYALAFFRFENMGEFRLHSATMFGGLRHIVINGLGAGGTAFPIMVINAGVGAAPETGMTATHVASGATATITTVKLAPVDGEWGTKKLGFFQLDPDTFSGAQSQWTAGSSITWTGGSATLVTAYLQGSAPQAATSGNRWKQITDVEGSGSYWNSISLLNQENINFRGMHLVWNGDTPGGDPSFTGSNAPSAYTAPLINVVNSKNVKFADVLSQQDLGSSVGGTRTHLGSVIRISRSQEITFDKVKAYGVPYADGLYDIVSIGDSTDIHLSNLDFARVRTNDIDGLDCRYRHGIGIDEDSDGVWVDGFKIYVGDSAGTPNITGNRINFTDASQNQGIWIDGNRGYTTIGSVLEQRVWVTETTNGGSTHRVNAWWDDQFLLNPSGSNWLFVHNVYPRMPRKMLNFLANSQRIVFVPSSGQVLEVTPIGGSFGGGDSLTFSLTGAAATHIKHDTNTGYMAVYEIVTGDTTFTAGTATDELTLGAHTIPDDTPVKISTTGTLPGGLAASTWYYVVNAAATTLQLSATVGGAVIDLTSAGTGTHTLHAYPGPGDTIDNGSGATATLDAVSSVAGNVRWEYDAAAITPYSQYLSAANEQRNIRMIDSQWRQIGPKVTVGY